MDIKHFYARRLCLLVSVLLVLLVLVYRLLDLSFFQSAHLKMLGEKRHFGVRSYEGKRGRIFDTYGTVLAHDVMRYDLVADPFILLKNLKYLQLIAAFLGADYAQLLAKVKRFSNRRYLVLKKSLSYEQYLSANDAMAFLSAGVGVYWEKRQSRFYPYGSSMGHLIGFTNYKNQGQEGLEFYLNERISGHSTKHKVLVDSRRRIFDALNVGKVWAEDGRDVHLYINADVQLALYRGVEEGFKSYGGKTASGIVVNYKTGEVLGMVSQPGFDPNDRGTLHPNRYRNRAVFDLFEPGSTIKPFVVAAGLSEKKIKPDELLDVSSPWFFLNHRIRDFRNYGQLTPKDILKKSSNVGAAKIAISMTPEIFWKKLINFGFGETCLAADFYQKHGALRHHSTWYGTDQAVLGYGYGLSTNLVQLACAYVPLFSGGFYKSLKIIKDPVYNRFYGFDQRQVLRSETVSKIKAWLVSNVEEEGGTAYRANVSHYLVGGKTGTVRLLDRSSGLYSEGSHSAIFAGALVEEDHPYLVVIMVNQPQSAYYGGEVAAKIFKQVVSGILRSGQGL